MKCPNCGFENQDIAKFCNECGWDLTSSEEKSFQDASLLENTQTDLQNEYNVQLDQKQLLDDESLLVVNINDSAGNSQNEENKKLKKFINLKFGLAAAASIVLISVAVIGGIKFINYKNDMSAATEVVNLINDIGSVAADNNSADKIYKASLAYKDLTEKQKGYVDNIEVLNDANKTYEIKKAKSNMITLATSLKSNSELCQAFFSDYSSVWYNAIYHKTDEYNNGDFSDFNNALSAFQVSSTYTSAQKTLNMYNTIITSTWQLLKNVPNADAEMFEAIKNLYTAYQPMYSLAIKPQGSYKSYTAEVQRLNGNYKTAYAALVAVMPEIENK